MKLKALIKEIENYPENIQDKEKKILVEKIEVLEKEYMELKEHKNIQITHPSNAKIVMSINMLIGWKNKNTKKNQINGFFNMRINI